MLVTCSTECEKFLILYTFLKLEILNGKTLIMTDTIEQAYKIKMFLLRFSIKGFVVNPESPKNFLKSVVHFFNIGQYSILILVNGVNLSEKLKYGDILNVVNFTMPRSWNEYKDASEHISFDNGSTLTLVYGD